MALHECRNLPFAAIQAQMKLLVSDPWSVLLLAFCLNGRGTQIFQSIPDKEPRDDAFSSPSIMVLRFSLVSTDLNQLFLSNLSII